MAPIPLKEREKSPHLHGDAEEQSYDDLSVTSVTRKISKIFKENPINIYSSGDTFDSSYLNPSDTLLSLNVSEAISKGDLNSLTAILKDLNTSALEFTTPYGNLLHISASLATLEDFKKILTWSGLNPNSVNNNDGSTALHVAVRLNRVDIVEYLLSLKDIDDTIKDIEGSACIDYCHKNKQLHKIFEVHSGKIEEFRTILSNPRVRNLVDFNSTNSYGETLLHLAAKKENEEIVKNCLKIGVDPFKKNKKGKVPIELTRNEKIRELLKHAPMIKSKEIPSPFNGNVKIEGFLYKYTNFANGFRPRWFVLENSILSYYNAPADYPIRCRGSINLEYVEIVQSESNNCKFDLITTNSSSPKSPGYKSNTVKIHLKADGQDEAKRWIIALIQAKEAASLCNFDYKPILSPINLSKHPVDSTMPHISSTNNIELASSIASRLEAQIMHELADSEMKMLLINDLKDLKSLLDRIDQLITQKSRRLEAQRKEKDILEDAVRSLALENNKWQTWARGQLSNIDPSSFSPNRSSPIEKHFDVITSLENQLESTREVERYDLIDNDDLYFDVYEETDEEDQEGFTESIENTLIIPKSNPTKSQTPCEIDSFSYPIVPRSKIPVDSTKMPAISLWNILKNVIRQQDLTRMPIPINFSEPLSMLQRMCEDLEYYDLLERAGEFESDPAKRLLYIAAFAITSYSSTDKRVSKPFNPLLGETFELVTPKFKYLAEQVSHHPPIGASHCSGSNFTYWNEVHVTSRFKAKYLELKPEGMSHLLLGRDQCHYSWNRVNTAVNNIIVGKIYLEHYGKMIIKSHGDDGLVAEIDFLANGWRRGTSNRIEGKIVDPQNNSSVIYKLSGTWNGSIEATKLEDGHNYESFSIWKRAVLPADSEIQYNFSSFAMTLNELNESLKDALCPTDSRLRPDQRAMEEGDFDSASKLKVKLEEKQRRTRKIQESDDSFIYTPKWFKRATERDTCEDHWEYTGGYWQSRESKEWPADVPHIYL